MDKYVKLVYLDLELEVSLKEYAGTLDRSVNWLINDLLKKAVDEHKKDKSK